MTEDRDPRVRQLVVELIELAPAAPPFPTAETAAAPPPRSRMRVVIAGAIVIALIAGVLGLIAAVGPKRGAVKPVTPAPAATTRAIAYVANDGLYVRDAGSTHARQVVWSRTVERPQWSADGRYLAYVEPVSGVGDVVNVVGPDAESHTVQPSSGRYAWSPKRDVLAMAIRGYGGSAGVAVYTLDGTTLALWNDATDFTWAPDGSLFVSTRVATPVRHDIIVHATLGATIRDVHVEPYAPNVTLPDGSGVYLLYFAGTTRFGAPIVWVDPDGSGSIALDGLSLVIVEDGESVLVAKTLVDRSWVRPGPLGDRLAVVASSGRMVTDSRQVVRCGVGPSSCALAAPATAATGRHGQFPVCGFTGCDTAPAAHQQTLDPAWSPDGRRLAFVASDASGDPNTFMVNGVPNWAARYAERRLWADDGNGAGPHAVTAAGRGVASPEWISNSKLVFVRDGALWQIEPATGRTDRIATLARRGTMPPDNVYDPTDIEGDTQWTDLFAVAPEPPSPAPTPASTIHAAGAPQWIGARFTTNGPGGELLIGGRPAHLWYWGDDCVKGGCDKQYSVMIAVTEPGVGEHVGRAYVWLTSHDPNDHGAYPTYQVLASMRIDVPQALYLSNDCHPRGETTPSVLAVVPSLADGVVEPAIRAWTADAAAQRIVELSRESVVCRFVVGP
jgi:WD40-like Beta Propeller Repeat